MRFPLTALWIAAGCMGTDPVDAPAPTAPSELPADAPAPPLDVEPVPIVSYDHVTSTYDNTAEGLFDRSVLHQVDIFLGNAQVSSLLEDPYRWVRGAVQIDGELVDLVGIRLRGKLGSFRDLDGKPKFKIDFNHYDPGRRFHGLETLALNNSVGDCSYLNEPLIFRAYALAGVPAPRVSFTAVTVNGEDYGLYQAFEFPDDAFLRRNFGEPMGNLYDGKYQLSGGWPLFLQVDFTPSLDHRFLLEEGTDVGLSDVYAVTDGLRAAQGQPDFMAQTAHLVNWPAFHRFSAVEYWGNSTDGYAAFRNNYRVYFDGVDGRVEWISWDQDASFGNPESSGTHTSPLGTVARMCMSDPLCKDGLRAEVARLIDIVDAEGLADDLAAWDALTIGPARDDPKRGCDLAQLDAERDGLHRWFEERPLEAARFWQRE